MQKGPLNTPFDCGCKAPPAHGKGNSGTYDRHVTPILNKAHDVGKDGVREKFFEDLPNQPPSWKSSLAGGTSMRFRK